MKQKQLHKEIRDLGAERKYRIYERTTRAITAMAATEKNVELKRKVDDDHDGDGDGDEEDAEWVGPMPSEATKAKKRKGGILAVHSHTGSFLLLLSNHC